MSHAADSPKVFVSYARINLDAAEKLARELKDRGLDVFLDIWNIPPGASCVLAINNALSTSDYYVLLWSAAAEGRYWVEMEYAAALVREDRLRRSFLFVVRLDDTELPTLLAPRQYIDAFGARSHDTAADALAAFWLADRAVGVSVMPAPPKPSTDDTRPTIADTRPTVRVYARNRALSVAHELTVPEETTGQELSDLIFADLKLPTEHTSFDGLVGLRFAYRFLLAGEAIPADSDTRRRLTDGSTIDLEVSMESFGPGGPLADAVPYLPAGSAALKPATIRSLFREAFKHLLP
jgi:hypothetical protein